MMSSVSKGFVATQDILPPLSHRPATEVPQGVRPWVLNMAANIRRAHRPVEPMEPVVCWMEGRMRVSAIGSQGGTLDITHTHTPRECRPSLAQGLPLDAGTIMSRDPAARRPIDSRCPDNRCSPRAAK